MDKIHVLVGGDEHWVEGGDFDDMLEAVKLIPGRQFDSEERVWSLPGSPQQIAKALRPYRLMHVDDDPMGDSKPIQVMP